MGMFSRLGEHNKRFFKINGTAIGSLIQITETYEILKLGIKRYAPTNLKFC